MNAAEFERPAGSGRVCVVSVVDGRHLPALPWFLEWYDRLNVASVFLFTTHSGSRGWGDRWGGSNGLLADKAAFPNLSADPLGLIVSAVADSRPDDVYRHAATHAAQAGCRWVLVVDPDEWLVPMPGTSLSDAIRAYERDFVTLPALVGYEAEDRYPSAPEWHHRTDRSKPRVDPALFVTYAWPSFWMDKPALYDRHFRRMDYVDADREGVRGGTAEVDAAQPALRLVDVSGVFKTRKSRTRDGARGEFASPVRML